MLGWRIKAASFLFVAIAACYPVQAQAQESGAWGVRLFPQGGYVFHIRKIGKNAATIQGQASNQVVAQLENGPVVGGGIEIALPDPSIHVRANVRTTVGAKVNTFLSICGEEGLPAGVGLCASGEQEVDTRIVEGSVDLVFFQQQSTQLLQPVLWFGVGVRSYDFDLDLPACGQPDIDAKEVCVRGREILENASTDPLLSLGLGVTTRPGPVSAFLQIETVITGYSGGAALAGGERVMDLLLQGGVSVRVR